MGVVVGVTSSSFNEPGSVIGKGPGYGRGVVVVV